MSWALNEMRHSVRTLHFSLALTGVPTISRSAKAPTTKGVEKSASESAGPKQGAEESAEKVLRGPSPVLFSTEARTPKHFFGTFFGNLFAAGTFRSTRFGTFPGWGFGTSLDGRHSRNLTRQTTTCTKA